MTTTDALVVADWFIVTVILLIFLAREFFGWHKIKVLALVGVITAASVFLACLPANFLAVSLVLLTMVLIYVGQQYSVYYHASFISLFLGVLSASMPVSFRECLVRVAAVLLATVVAALLNLFLIPYFKHLATRRLLVQALRQLDAVCTDAFSCLLQPDYAETVYLFERRLHKQKIIFMQTMLQMGAAIRLQVAGDEKEWLQESINIVDEIYAAIIEAAMVRWRVTDATIFSLCRKELVDVYREICKAFLEAIAVVKSKQAVIATKQLEYKIHALEENYSHVLQVAAKEPLMVMLFIDSLKLLSAKLGAIRGRQDDS